MTNMIIGNIITGFGIFMLVRTIKRYYNVKTAMNDYLADKISAYDLLEVLKSPWMFKDTKLNDQSIIGALQITLLIMLPMTLYMAILLNNIK